MNINNSSISGLYVDNSTGNELRLDVDGNYPQMIASGTFNSFVDSINWLADLTTVDSNTWEGAISFKHPETAQLPFVAVRISTSGTRRSGNLKVIVSFINSLGNETANEYKFRSPRFHDVEFEYDTVEGTSVINSIETHAHPNRPASLPSETLTIKDVYERSGFNVTVSTDPDNVVPLKMAASIGELPGDRILWDETEMHDAMQTFWSRFESKSQWAMWVFFAGLHEDGPELGGIMFDDIGPNHRQGTAIFNDSFIKDPPFNDPNPEAWVQRTRFWTAVHEMGHAFNLAHAWQKDLDFPLFRLGKPWRPISSDDEARSFMNYPFRVQGGQERFFQDFEFRFIDEELQFLRHAPEEFVQMGNANWFDNHGFQKFDINPSSAFNLELRVNRDIPDFEYMEAITAELKLKNISEVPQLVDLNTLSDSGGMTVIIKKDNKPARLYTPFVHHCLKRQNVVINPEDALYDSLFVSAGQNGWDLADPGYYTIQIAISLEAEDVISNPLRLRVAPPKSYDEEYIAQDFFSEDVGRVMALDGSRYLTKANDTLKEITEKLPKSKVAIHCHVALGSPCSYEFKQLQVDAGMSEMKSARNAGGKIAIKKPDEKEATMHFEKALMENTDLAAESLGHIDYKIYSDLYSDFQEICGLKKHAIKVQNSVYKTLYKRGVLKSVLSEISAKGKSYEGKKK